MAGAPFVIAPRTQVSAEAALAPAHNILTSMAALNVVDRLDDADPWLAATAAALDLIRRRNNRLLFEVLGDALVPEKEADDLEMYLTRLQQTRPERLRDRVLERLRPAPGSPAAESASAEALLDDFDTFQDRLGQTYPDVEFDRQLLRQAHRLLNDPLRLRDTAVGHLRSLWDAYFSAEWQRSVMVLRHMVDLLDQRGFAVSTPAETIREFTSREVPPATAAQLEGIRKIVFVLSPHVGSIASRFGSEDTIWVFVRALDAVEGKNARQIAISRLPIRQAPIKAVELVNPFAALADETRLQILQLLAEGEMLAQDIIARMDLSQSSISRHLKMLVSTGLVLERRAEGANKRYRLDPTRVEWIWTALRRLLAGQPAAEATVRDEQALELRRFLDAEGRVVIWPARQRDRDLVLDYLASHFARGATPTERGREYEEREINHILSRWDRSLDPATLRRILFETRRLARTTDGRSYWVPEA